MQNRIKDLLALAKSDINLTEFILMEQFTDKLAKAFIAIGAEPSVGKTQLMAQLALDVVRTNLDTKVLLVNLDDSLATTYIRVLASMTGIPHVLVKNQEMINQDAVREHLFKAIEILQKLEDNQRIHVCTEAEVFKGSTSARNLFEHRMNKFRRLVEREYIENKKLVLIVDHASNIYAVASGNESENAGRLATFLKSLSHGLNIPVITTLETNKAKSESSQLKGSAKVMYAPDLILHLSKDSDNPNATVQMEIQKNKINGVSGRLELDWNKTKTNFEVKRDELQLLNLTDQDFPLKSLDGYFSQDSNPVSTQREGQLPRCA